MNTDSQTAADCLDNVASTATLANEVDVQLKATQAVSNNECSVNISETGQSKNDENTSNSPTNSNCNSNNNNNNNNNSSSSGGASSSDSGRRYRPQKYCAVCGDKAIACNFNAVTCESCKAFFRRNAFKEQRLKCLFNNRCIIDRVTRRFCSKCRLLKCFQIGMKREWILTDEQKLIKRVKILQNKQSRQQNSMPNSPLPQSIDSPNLQQQRQASPATDDASLTSNSSNNNASDKIEQFSNLIRSQTAQSMPADEVPSQKSKQARCTQALAKQAKVRGSPGRKDASTSCPDEFDLLTVGPTSRLIPYCSLAAHCQYCSYKLIECASQNSTHPIIHHQPLVDYHQQQQQQQQQHHHHHHMHHQQFHPSLGVAQVSRAHYNSVPSAHYTSAAPVNGQAHQQDIRAHMNTAASTPTNSCCCLEVRTAGENYDPHQHFTTSTQHEQQKVESHSPQLHIMTPPMHLNGTENTTVVHTYDVFQAEHQQRYATPVQQHSDNQSLTSIGNSTSSLLTNLNSSSPPDQTTETHSETAFAATPESQMNQLDLDKGVIVESENKEKSELKEQQYIVWKGELYHEPAFTEVQVRARLEKLDFCSNEKELIEELIDATRFMFEHNNENNKAHNSLNDIVYFCDVALRRLIKTVKQIKAFRMLTMDDQIVLLKTACFKILLLRSTFHYQDDIEGWLDVKSGRVMHIDILKRAKKSLVYERHKELINKMPEPLRRDRLIMSIMSLTLLFDPSITLKHTNSVSLDNLIYLSILRKYLVNTQPDPLNKYERLVAALQVINACNVEYNVFFSKDFQPEQITPLLIEIFDISVENSD